MTKRTVLLTVQLLSLIATPLWSLETLAQEQSSASRFTFGGACASQGQWTNQALEATNRIQTIIRNLKDDPNCKGFGDSIRAAVAASATEIKSLQSDKEMGRLLDIPNELEALRSVGQASKGDRSQIIKLLFNRGLEAAQIQAKRQSDMASSILPSSNANIVSSLMSMKQRFERVGVSSLNIFEAIAEQAPRLDECLIGKDSVGQYFSASFQLAASLLQSGQGYSSRFANLFSKMTSSLRERKFTEALGVTDRAQLLMSMQCLVETTSETYCSAVDAQALFNKTVNDLELQVKRGESGSPVVDAENPFQGYYILAQQVPVVTAWLQKIQIGIDPQLPTDAQFQKNILDDINEHIKKTKDLQAFFRYEKRRLLGQESMDAKINGVFNLLKKIVDSMGNDRGINFFLQSINEYYVPFYLIGRKDVPPEVTGNNERNTVLAWDVYMSEGGTYKRTPEFKDPIALLEIMQDKLDDLIANSNIEANKYYTTWFIVDKVGLVNESVIGFRYTVLDSLRQIHNYLTHLKAKVKKYNGDEGIYTSIIDTQNRIQKILKAYEPIKKMTTLKFPLSKEQEDLIQDNFKKIILTVYEEFNVLLQKASFVTNRMMNFVQYDYSLMLKNKVNFTKYEEDLFYITGLAIVDKMSTFYANNPAFVKQDLDNAMVVNTQNINALEMVFKDNLIKEMAFLKRVAEGKSTREWPMYWATMKRLYKDTHMPRVIPKDLVAYNNGHRFDKTQWNEENPVKSFFATIGFPYFNGGALFFRYKGHQDRYDLNLSKKVETQEDQNHSHAKLLAKLCVQTLAFSDWKAFIPYCNGVTYTSTLNGSVEDKNTNLVVNWNKKLSEAYIPNDRNSLAENKMKRVCALRDWSRSNGIYWLTLNMKRDQLQLQEQPEEVQLEEPVQ